MSLYLGNDLISGNKPINLGVRNIGEIVASSLPFTDAGLHLLDGSLILGGGIYQGFVDYIADLYTANPSANYFTTEAAWQTSVTTYGVCGKFVYDSINNTVRLPKVTGIIEGTTDLTALGDLIEAGLPSIEHTHTYTRHSNLNGAYTAQYNNGCWGEYTATTSVNSAVNSIYGKSNTVQPQTIKVLYYIVIATTSKTEIQVDIDEIATDLNGKTDVDFSNITNVANIKMAHNAMPSGTVKWLTVGASGTTYTAPADGWVTCVFTATGSNGWGLVATNSNVGQHCFWPTSGGGTRAHIPVRKGNIITVNYGSATFNSIAFTYANGSESEAS